jgi:hypothetical protein
MAAVRKAVMKRRILFCSRVKLIKRFHYKLRGVHYRYEKLISDKM